jgi:soluble lytic murein transglycosylase-like protein
MIRLGALQWAGVLVGLVFAGVAHAELYVYKDDQGVIHLARHRLDARYQSFDHYQPPSSAMLPREKQAQRAARFDDLIAATASAYQLDRRLLHSIIAVESGFNPSAISPKGAIGLMQVMPDTGRRFGVANLSDPQQNLIAGARYLRALLARFNGNLPLVIAAYNAGEGAVQRYGNTIPPYNETQGYVAKVLTSYHRNASDTLTAGVIYPAPLRRQHAVLIIRGDESPAAEN